MKGDKMKKKKYLAVILSAALCLTAFGTYAAADELEGITPP